MFNQCRKALDLRRVKAVTIKYNGMTKMRMGYGAMTRHFRYSALIEYKSVLYNITV